MADILIRGMEMPKILHGEPCCVDVRIFADGSVIMAKTAPPYYERFEAIQLPEGHGRLIDANELELDLVRHNGAIGFELIGNAPTVVPAEGGTYNG